MSPAQLSQRVSTHLDEEILSIHQNSSNSSAATFIAQSLSDKKYFIKINSPAPQAIACESTGLARLAQHHKNTPKVLHFDHEMLITSFIETETPTEIYWQNLARDLAKLHQCSADFYGFHEDNWIGAARQKNISDHKNNWGQFFWQCRIEYKLHELKQKNLFRLSDHSTEKLKKACLSQLGAFDDKPCPLHGDLWSGNVMCGVGQKPWLIDPAFYYGDREADIAMTQCFGGFPEVFYSTYHDVFPLDPGFEKRRHIYNLYHMLNHFVIFGESYLAPSQNIISLVCENH